MGLSADEIDRSSMWQFHAMAEGYRKAHQSEEDAAKELSYDELDELSKWVVS
ncbi:hypothetical protein OIU34_26605 [Pararhizobium sp. BT-229]|uniref:hypothetical protein n=1 Tax=Pararhizobium sp. BT-229 TaxID=2986923 RepID=UPI0021F6DD65|nr:hypothetical protein [Pararhizobium sp. BT-229]MCV9965454.1 hypothetical protein [Pararhizobium sp. BT-229]